MPEVVQLAADLVDASSSEKHESPPLISDSGNPLSVEVRILQLLQSQGEVGVDALKALVASCGVEEAACVVAKVKARISLGRTVVPYIPGITVQDTNLSLLQTILLEQIPSNENLRCLVVGDNTPELGFFKEHSDQALRTVCWDQHIGAMSERIKSGKVALMAIASEITDFIDFVSGSHLSQWNLFYLQRACLMIVDLAYQLFPRSDTSDPGHVSDPSHVSEFLNSFMFPLIGKIEWLTRSQRNDDMMTEWPRVTRDLAALRHCTLQDVKLKATEMLVQRNLS
eukprot:Protomagalhaensia_sp_Gyna_25__2172@NODE_217_length_4339_cov_94_141163_g169_i0_p2_GENE_NODE_217_length_4339_cov_94_141163_g169_i0NODE_217_length_4339_cov_94_141163_g169_i0_p2_ORF_typecomplete_len283_score61_59_NODE_217_length_4339_cov_94_141163_g169_i026673515